jgi:hypothetical protein
VWNTLCVPVNGLRRFPYRCTENVRQKSYNVRLAVGLRVPDLRRMVYSVDQAADDKMGTPLPTALGTVEQGR